MTRIGFLLGCAALTSGGCVALPRRSIEPGPSLVGAWAYKDRIASAFPIDPMDCGTDFGVNYAPDGRFSGYDEEGRWSLSGDMLTEVVEREPGENGDMAAITPKTRRGRLSWLSPRHVNVDFDGEVGGMIRCPD